MSSLNGDDGHAGAGKSSASPGMPLIELERIADGGFAEVEASIDGEPESLVLFRDGDAVRAWLNVCPHAGRRLDWAPGQFLRSKDGLLVCAAHGAGFELQRGECVSGPCRGQSLRAVAVEVDGGEVFLGRESGMGNRE
jgi:nitrite reductase/ring-hydroxylating ferredoxin subunit